MSPNHPSIQLCHRTSASTILHNHNRVAFNICEQPALNCDRSDKEMRAGQLGKVPGGNQLAGALLGTRAQANEGKGRISEGLTGWRAFDLAVLGWRRRRSPHARPIPRSAAVPRVAMAPRSEETDRPCRVPLRCGQSVALQLRLRKA